MINAIFVAIGFGFFTLHLLRFEGVGKLAELALFSLTLIVLLLFDLRLWRIPKEIAIAALISAFIFGVFGVQPELIDRVLGAVFGYVSLACLLVVATFTLRALRYIKASSFALGAGDPLALAVVGAFMGYEILPLVVLLAGVQAIAAFAILTVSGAKMRSPHPDSERASMPLGAFFCLAALELICSGFAVS